MGWSKGGRVAKGKRGLPSRGRAGQGAGIMSSWYFVKDGQRNGPMGREELDVIAPAVEQARAEGMQLAGPIPADTAFLPAKLAATDAVLAMYHDQGLPVLKYSGFEQAVNLTLGLPYPRVAVDHGTALDIAGTGKADPASLIAALRLAGEMAQARHRAAA